jgi:virulence factor Mce-like protein
MRRRRGSSAVLGNPVLVGAVTLLVVNVAVFLSWFANRGLPFVPTKQVKVEFPNGANLLPGNEVRSGGFRIGIVDDMQPVPLKDGSGVGAIVTLKLDKKNGDVPADSKAIIRPRSVLGLKYVELDRGTSSRILADGDTIPASQTHIPVDLDEFQNIFDDETRDGARRNLRGFGDALAQRGPSLNRTIEELPRFLTHLEPVARALGDEDTQLGRFFGELGDFVRIAKPVRNEFAHSYTAGADTFEAWSRYPDELRATIEKSWPTMQTGIQSFKVQRPFLASFRDFSDAVADAAAELPRTLPRITPALRTGIPVLRRSPQINEELEKTFVTLQDLMESPGTGASFRGLEVTVDTLNPLLRHVGPYITVCNYFNYSWTHVAEHLTEPDPTGGSQRTLLNQAGQQVDTSDGPARGQRTNITALGAAYPANGGQVQPNSTAQFLHSNNYSAAVTKDGKADCESGQRGYIEKQNFYNPDPNVKTVVDPHIPGAQGPTFTGRAQVPEGQTFDRHPQIGPAFPAELETDK